MEVLNFGGVCTFIVVVVVGGGGGGGIFLYDMTCKLSSWLALLCNLHPWLPADGVGAILSVVWSNRRRTFIVETLSTP